MSVIVTDQSHEWWVGRLPKGVSSSSSSPVKRRLQGSVSLNEFNIVPSHIPCLAFLFVLLAGFDP